LVGNFHRRASVSFVAKYGRSSRLLPPGRFRSHSTQLGATAGDWALAFAGLIAGQSLLLSSSPPSNNGGEMLSQFDCTEKCHEHVSHAMCGGTGLVGSSRSVWREIIDTVD
jgi:hypothetical protein